MQYQQQMQQGPQGLWDPYRSDYSNGSTVSSPRTDTTAYCDSDGSPIGVNVGGELITIP